MLERLAAVVGSTLALVAASAGSPSQAWADTCVPVPVNTIGLTIGAGGQEVRVPAISNVQVCIWGNDSYGSFVPDIRTPSGCGSPCVSVVVIDWNWHWSYGVSYDADGSSRTTRVTQPPIMTGPPGETCLLSIGAPADTSCLVFVNVG